MFGKIIKSLGNKLVTYLILITVLNFILSYFYFYYITDLLNNLGLVSNNTFNDPLILTIIYGIFVSGYLFIYISIFLFVIKRVNINNKQSFILGSLNLYLILYTIIFAIYVLTDINTIILKLYFIILPIISLGTVIFKGGDTEIQQDNRYNNQINYPNTTNELMDKIENDNNMHDFTNTFNIENKKEDNLIKENIKEDKKESIFAGLSDFFKGLFEGDTEDDIYKDINKEVNENIFDNLNLDKQEDISNNIPGISINTIKDELIDIPMDNLGERHNDGMKIQEDKEFDADDILNANEGDYADILDVDEDKIEIDDNNFFKLGDEEYELDEISIEEKVSVNNINGSGDNEIKEETPFSRFFIKGFSLDKVQELDLAETLINEL